MDRVEKLAVLDPDKKYLIFVHIARRHQKDEDVVCNKMELAFKAMGVKNIKALPHTAQVLEIK